MPRLLVALTAHGYGHVAQTAPVINALRRRLPALQLTIYTSVPRSVLHKRFDGEFELVRHAADPGMRMKDALEVDAAASAHAYRLYHRRWEQTVAAEAKFLSNLAPDAVLANVPYRILAASAQAGIPASAMCSLNWADIYRHFCGDLPGSAAILAQMLGAYRSAHAFLQPAPSMPMTHLDNRVAIGPIAEIGDDRRAEITQRTALPDTAKLILVSLGGVPTQLNMSAWPALPDVYWIVPAAWAPQRRDAIAFESLAMDFVDVLRSVDALVTKPGYGSFVEAACNGVPVLYVPRRDWPEEACLVDWLRRHGRVLAIRREQLEQGDLAAALEELCSQPRQEAVNPAGIGAAADHLAELLKE